jgi:hypothetical protein
MGEINLDGKEKAKAIEEGEADYSELYLNEGAKDDLIKFTAGTQTYWGRVEDEEITIEIKGDLMFSVLREGDRVPESEIADRADKEGDLAGVYIKECGWATYFVTVEKDKIVRKERRAPKARR